MQKKTIGLLLLILAACIGCNRNYDPAKHFEVISLDDGTVEITEYVGGLENVRIPPRIRRKTVSSIGASVIIMGEYAFENNQLVSINFGENALIEYVAGFVLENVYFENDPIPWPVARATLWKNGIPMRLSNNDSMATDVFVYGSDVYVTGSIGIGNDIRAMLWINGEAQALSDNISSAARVFVSGGDVHVLVYERDANHRNTRLLLWKNGAVQTLDFSFGLSSGIYGDNVSGVGVYSFGSDVYLTGSLRGNNSAGFWKNGEMQTLHNAVSTARQVYVHDSDVYVAGFTGNEWGSGRASLWVNGERQALSNSLSTASFVQVSGSDVYVAGSIHQYFVYTQDAGYGPRVTLWKNGEAQILNNSQSSVLGLYVYGSDVYVLSQEQRGLTLRINGEVQDIDFGEGVYRGSMFGIGSNVYIVASKDYHNHRETDRAVIWKNGAPITLSDTNSHAVALFVTGGE